MKFSRLILDGQVTDLEQFAKKCILAFGATEHMQKDNSESDDYIQREADEAYEKELQEMEKRLDYIKNLSDEEIISNHVSYLSNELEYYKEDIARIRENRSRIEKILEDAKSWEIPSEDHQEFKEFMIEDLEEGLKKGCDESHHVKRIEEINEEFKMDANSVRERILKGATEDIERQKKEVETEKQLADDSNAWVEQIIKSFNQK
jgi:hypothetical protein